MSASIEAEVEANPLERYVQGEQRYVHFAEDVLDVDLAEVQADILRTVTTHKNTVISSGNGVGKSYAVAILCLSFLYCNPRGSVLLTSGSYQQIESTVWPTMKALLADAREAGFPLPGTVKEAQPRIEFADDPEKAFRAISTRDPGELEGRHAPRQLVVVDEADKVQVDQQVLESARSSVTDDRDRFVAIGNPPRSEANSMYELLVNDNYATVNFSSFDSHNVRIDAGLADGEKLPGLVDLAQLREDYELWHPGDEFPGLEDAMAQVEADEDDILRPTEDGLDERWVRRRLGAVPDAGTEAVRPFHVDDIEGATDRWADVGDRPDEYDAYGVDIARGGDDRTVVVGLTAERADVLADREAPGDHRRNKRLIENALGDTDAPVIVDAIGEGSGVADELDRTYNVTRFKANATAREREKYYDRRAEALGKLGEWLGDGAIDPSDDVTAELREAARHIEFTEKSTRTAYAWTATSKSDLKQADKMGRSPDLLDALSLAAWGLTLQASTADAGYAFYSY